MLAGGTSLNAFWVLNICKEAYPAFKELLNFYPVTGPLLGLYLASFATFVVVFVLVRSMRWGSATERILRWYFMLSVLLFFLMTFPPVWEPIVGVLVR